MGWQGFWKGGCESALHSDLEGERGRGVEWM